LVSRSPSRNTAAAAAPASADAAAEGEGQQAGDGAGEHDRRGQVAEEGDPQAAAGDLPQLGQVLVVEPVEALPEEGREAEGAQLLGGILAAEQHVEVVAVALDLGHAVVEAEQQLPGPGRGHQQRHGRRQHQRHQPGLQREQGAGHAEDRDQRAGQPHQPLHDLPGPELAAHRRPQQPVVEARGVVGLQLDRAGHLDDLGLGVPGGQLGEDLGDLAADGVQEAQPGGDGGQQQQLGEDRAGAGAAAAGGGDRGDHVPPEQQHDRQAGAVDGLDDQGGQQLPAAGGPHQPHRLTAEPRQAPQRPGAGVRGVDDVVPGDRRGVVAVGRAGPLRAAVLAHAPIVPRPARSAQAIAAASPVRRDGVAEGVVQPVGTAWCAVGSDRRQDGIAHAGFAGLRDGASCGAGGEQPAQQRLLVRVLPDRLDTGFRLGLEPGGARERRERTGLGERERARCARWRRWQQRAEGAEVRRGLAVFGRPQVATATRPPCRTTRAASAAAAAGRAAYWKALMPETVSKLPSFHGSRSISPSRRSAPGRRSRAIATSAAAASSPATSAPRWSAARRRKRPAPQPTSSTRVPAPTPRLSAIASNSGMTVVASWTSAQSRARALQRRP
jgi:hypothetical protein